MWLNFYDVLQIPLLTINGVNNGQNGNVRILEDEKSLLFKNTLNFSSGAGPNNYAYDICHIVVCQEIFFARSEPLSEINSGHRFHRPIRKKEVEHCIGCSHVVQPLFAEKLIY